MNEQKLMLILDQDIFIEPVITKIHLGADLFGDKGEFFVGFEEYGIYDPLESWTVYFDFNNRYNHLVETFDDIYDKYKITHCVLDANNVIYQSLKEYNKFPIHRTKWTSSLKDKVIKNTKSHIKSGKQFILGVSAPECFLLSLYSFMREQDG